SRDRADEAVAVGLGRQPERRLDPRGERIGEECFEVWRRLAVDASSQRASELFVLTRRHGRAPERLADDVLALDFVPEDKRSNPSTPGALLLQRACASESGRRANVLERLCVTCLADPAGEKRDICALPAAIGVELIEDQKAKILRCLDDGAVEWPRQD